MRIAAPLLLLAALGAPAAAQPEPYSCEVPIVEAGLTGGMWRDFGFPGPDDFYKIQLQNPAIETSPFALWLIDNRPPAPPRRYGYDVGRPEAVVFRQGPDSVSFGTIAHGEVADGALWVRLYGDSFYAGAFRLRSARQTRRAHRTGGWAVTVSVSQRTNPQIVARLADAGSWEAVLVDGMGRELGRRSVRVPTAAQMERAFRQSRTALLRERDAFVATGSSGNGRGARCFLFEPPEI